MTVHARLYAPSWSCRPQRPLFENRPPHPWSGSAKPPAVTNIETFAAVHRWADNKVKNYVECPKRNHRAVLGRDAFRELRDDDAFCLYANNAVSRIAFAEIVLKHVLADRMIEYGPTCFVTLTPAKCAFPLDDRRFSLERVQNSINFPVIEDHSAAISPPEGRETKRTFEELLEGLETSSAAVLLQERTRLLIELSDLRRKSAAANFDVLVLQQLARQALGGLPFIGVVEAALFKRWSPNGVAPVDWISWHCHLIVWGANQAEVSGLLSGFRDRHKSMQDSPAAHVQEIAASEVERGLVYSLKAPQKAYHRNLFPRLWLSPTTGEIRQAGYHTQKDWLRTGDRVRLMDVMAGRTLDRLLFGCGTGTELVRAIRQEALQPFREWEQRQHRA